MKRIAEVLNEKSDLVNPEHPVYQVDNGDVVFENVDFAYNSKSEKPVLSNVNFTVKQGETIGIIGGTGSAKSSLVKCRNPEIHALLGLRGKPLNTTGLEIEQVLSNQEMKDLISSIGVGVNDYHDMSEVRYGKVIIVADAKMGWCL